VRWDELLLRLYLSSGGSQAHAPKAGLRLLKSAICSFIESFFFPGPAALHLWHLLSEQFWHIVQSAHVRLHFFSHCIRISAVIINDFFIMKCPVCKGFQVPEQGPEFFQ